MGFSIGSFLGSIAPIVGGIFGGPVGAAIGGAVGAGFASQSSAPSVVGRQTAPIMQRPQQLTSVVPVPVNVPRVGFAPSRFSGGGGTQTLTGGIVGGVARGAVSMFGAGVAAGGIVSEILQRSRESVGRGVTKKKIIAAAKTCGIGLAADSFGISESDVCRVIVSGAGRRRRGISAADVRRTKRTLRFVKKIKADVKSIRL